MRLLRLAKAVTRISAPSSSRMFREILLAMYSSTSAGTVIPSWSVLRRRMAIRVSRSGGWMSVVSPQPNRVRMRSSKSLSLFGAMSEVMTICLLALCRVLKVWKNSSCVCTLPDRNWMSSTSSTSTSR